MNENESLRPSVSYLSGAPAEIGEGLKSQMVTLVVEGGQVELQFAGPGVENAQRLALLLSEGLVVACASLKNPNPGYRDGVFVKSKAPQSPAAYPFELGYIVTNPKYLKMGFCRELLDRFFPEIARLPCYATTRKGEMVHVLSTHGFYKTGLVYGDQLELLLYDPKV